MEDVRQETTAFDNQVLFIENKVQSSLIESDQIHRNDSQIELNNYYINYVDDLFVSLDIKLNENKSSSLLLNNERSCQLEISNLSDDIFENENIRCEFECIFHEFDPKVIISYSKLFKNAYLTFSNRKLTNQIQKEMNGKEFHCKKLDVKHVLQKSSSTIHLKPPKQDNIYMQSPPTTPPIGWIAQREQLPDINFDIFLALSKLQPNEPFEILSKQDHLPAIVIHPCSDSSDDEMNVDFGTLNNPVNQKFKLKQHETVQNNEYNQDFNEIKHIFDERKVNTSSGDGDKLLI